MSNTFTLPLGKSSTHSYHLSAISPPYPPCTLRSRSHIVHAHINLASISYWSCGMVSYRSCTIQSRSHMIMAVYLSPISTFALLSQHLSSHSFSASLITLLFWLLSSHSFLSMSLHTLFRASLITLLSWHLSSHSFFGISLIPPFSASLFGSFWSLPPCPCFLRPLVSSPHAPLSHCDMCFPSQPTSLSCLLFAVLAHNTLFTHHVAPTKVQLILTTQRSSATHHDAISHRQRRYGLHRTTGALLPLFK